VRKALNTGLDASAEWARSWCKYARNDKRLRSRCSVVEGARVAVGDDGSESFDPLAVEKFLRFGDDFAPRSRGPILLEAAAPLLAEEDRSLFGGGGTSSPG
jgi:hypothetical protein